MRLYVRLLVSLIPRPDIAFVVDADPDAAYRRKPEYPLEFVRQNRDSYIALSRVVRGMTVLPPRSGEKKQPQRLRNRFRDPFDRRLSPSTSNCLAQPARVNRKLRGFESVSFSRKLPTSRLESTSNPQRLKLGDE